MTKLESLEKEVESLSSRELAAFRAWFAEYDWALWDRQLEQDADSGRLDTLANEALAEHARGETTDL